MRRRSLSILVLPLLFAASLASAQQPHPVAHARPITYVKRGMPVRRVSAGVRGYSDVPLDRLPVALVAPHDHVPWTIHTQPTLFWRYAGKRDQIARAVVQFTRGTRVDSFPLTITNDALQRIDIAPLGLTLARDADYKWSVRVYRHDAALPPESDEAWLRVVGANTLGTEPNDPIDLAHASAAVGLWYDAFAALTAAQRAAPDDDSLGAAASAFVASTVRGLTLAPSSSQRKPQ